VSAGPQLPQGYVLHAFDRVESTNDEARRLAEQGAPAGAVVVAAEQVKGRGRHGRTWA
jgi:BirA family biotin operon repressor/biotin-[acetyl-CoA-carboxylase] ligase